MYFFWGNTAEKSIENGEYSFVVVYFELLLGDCFSLFRREREVGFYLRAAHGFEKCLLKGRAYRHDFARCLHLSAERSGRTGKLVERPFREFHNGVVERRLACGAAFSGDIVRYLVESVAECGLYRYFCNRVTGSL